MRDQGRFRSGLGGVALLAAALPGTAMAQAVAPDWAQSARMGAVNVLKGEALVIAGNDVTYLDRKRGWPRIEAAMRAGMERLGNRLGGPTPIRIDIEVLEFFGTRGLAANSYNLQLRYTVSEPGGQIISRSGRRNLDRAAGAVSGADAVLAEAVAGDVAAWLSALDCPATICAPDPAALAFAPEARPEASATPPAPLPEPAAKVVVQPPVAVVPAPAPPPDAAAAPEGEGARAPEPPSLLARIFLGDAPAPPGPVPAEPEPESEAAGVHSPVLSSRPVAAPRPAGRSDAEAAPAVTGLETPAAADPVAVAGTVAEPAPGPAPVPVESRSLPEAAPDVGTDTPPGQVPEEAAGSPSLLTRLFGDPAPAPAPAPIPEAGPDPLARTESDVARATATATAPELAEAPPVAAPLVPAPLIGTPPPARPKLRATAPEAPVAGPDAAPIAERVPPAPPAAAPAKRPPVNPAPAARVPVPDAGPAPVTASALPDPSPGPAESRTPAPQPETVQVATALLTAEREATAALAGVVPRPVAPDFALSAPGTLAAPEAPEVSAPPPSRPTAPSRVDSAAAPAAAAPETAPVAPEVPVSAPVPVVAPAPSVVGVPAVTPPPPRRSFFARLFFPDPAPAAPDTVETASADPTAPQAAELTAVAASPLPPASPALPDTGSISPAPPDTGSKSPARPDTETQLAKAAPSALRSADPIRVTAVPGADAPEVASATPPPGLPLPSAAPEAASVITPDVARVTPDAPAAPAPVAAADPDPRPAPNLPSAVVAPPLPSDTAVIRSGPQPSLATAKWIGSSEAEVSDEKRAGGWMRSGMVTIEAKGWVTDEATGISAEVVLLPVKAGLGDRAQLSPEAMRALGLVPGQIATVSVYLRRP